ncbi:MULTISPECIES: PucR family transcriptional regulator [unclassified Paenibacillus]|uniref:PucR family transcriptional regulator n=1 Tax=Paenibacillus TaxID=44249 RepID=UPI001575E117|nr:MULTISPECIES: PucR family transcriptional regulator [unclassified Paenibacillus]NTZ18113.1 PucR family transcriptional regulator [Paenibacillus sp. JMULE4]
MKLADLFQLPLYQNIRVLAGHEGLQRQVKSINMMDAPDIMDYLKPDELLLTTAYAIRDRPEELLRLVRHMAASQCAGLGIKTKRFLDQIPKSVLELADEIHFPIIELPLHPPLGELLQESLSYIMEKRNEELRYALQMHREFSRLVMQGQGIPSVINALSPLVGGTVLLINHRLQFEAGSGPVTEPFGSRLLSQTRELLARREDGQSRIVSLCFVHGGLKGPEVVFYPIELTQQRCFLVLVNAQMDDSPLPKLAIEQAANVIGFELMKRQAVKERSRRFKNEFFEDLVEGRFRSVAEMLHQGKRYGLQEPYPCLCVVGKVDESLDSAEDNLYSKRDRIYEHLKTMLAERQQPYILFNKKDLFVTLLKWERSLQQHEFQLLDRLTDFQEKLFQTEHISLSFGIGNPVEHLTLIPSTYKEALNALHLGYQSRQFRFVQSYRAKEVVELLKMIPQEALGDFYKESFHALLEIDFREREELMNTARVFLETHGQIAETAKRLFIHRNTVAYRLHKYEQLTRRSLRDPNDSLRFRLAFLIDKVLEDFAPRAPANEF